MKGGCVCGVAVQWQWRVRASRRTLKLEGSFRVLPRCRKETRKRQRGLLSECRVALGKKRKGVKKTDSGLADDGSVSRCFGVATQSFSSDKTISKRQFADAPTVV
jgi:hypothetical protein